MPLVNWGFLGKSQFDQETIEEAIARLILAHCDDETAHLGIGQSLQSHKASEIIDHLAASIVADKIGDREVLDQHLQRDRQVIALSFDSLDGFTISAPGTGAAVTVKGGGCQILPGSVLDNVAYFLIDALVNNTFNHMEPDLQVSFSLLNSSGQHPERIDADFCLGLGYAYVTGQSVGFFWDGSAQKMYAYYRNGASVTQFEISSFDPAYLHNIRIEVRDVGDTLRFYLDDVLVKEYTGVAFSFSLPTYVSVIAKNQSNGNNHPLRFCGLIWSQSRYYIP